VNIDFFHLLYHRQITLNGAPAPLVLNSGLWVRPVHLISSPLLSSRLMIEENTWIRPVTV
jgi:hypothetical protein